MSSWTQAVALSHKGDDALLDGRFDEAVEVYRQISDSIPADPGTDDEMRTLLRALFGFAESLAFGPIRDDRAYRFYLASFEIGCRIQDPDQYDLLEKAICYEKMGNLSAGAGEHPQAIAELQMATSLAVEAYDAFPNAETGWRIVYEATCLARALHDHGQTDDAQEWIDLASQFIGVTFEHGGGIPMIMVESYSRVLGLMSTIARNPELSLTYLRSAVSGGQDMIRIAGRTYARELDLSISLSLLAKRLIEDGDYAGVLSVTETGIPEVEESLRRYGSDERLLVESFMLGHYDLEAHLGLEQWPEAAARGEVLRAMIPTVQQLAGLLITMLEVELNFGFAIYKLGNRAGRDHIFAVIAHIRDNIEPYAKPEAEVLLGKAALLLTALDTGPVPKHLG